MYADLEDPRNKQNKKQYYEEHRQEYIDRAKAARAEKRDWLAQLKNFPCMDCGVQYPPYVMDFDHRDGNEKDRAISWLVSNNSGWNRLKAEVEKCDLVCANCHRIRTHWRLTNPVMTCTLLA